MSSQGFQSKTILDVTEQMIYDCLIWNKTCKIVVWENILGHHKRCLALYHQKWKIGVRLNKIKGLKSFSKSSPTEWKEEKSKHIALMESLSKKQANIPFFFLGGWPSHPTSKPNLFPRANSSAPSVRIRQSLQAAALQTEIFRSSSSRTSCLSETKIRMKGGRSPSHKKAHFRHLFQSRCYIIQLPMRAF